MRESRPMFSPIHPGILGIVLLANTLTGQVTWTDRTVAASPAARYGYALAHDSSYGRTVLFGGVDAAANNFGDTWLWDGTTWAPMSTPIAPAPRRRSAMAFDSVRNVCVLYGGYSGSFNYPETWEWDGATWTLRTLAHQPGARDSHAMAYDPIRQRVVLFAGSTGVTVNDTWEYDGVDWQQMAPPVSPSARVDHRMAWMPTIGKVVMFAGWSGSNMDDTWTWDGASWALVSPAGKPPSRVAHGMAFDAARNRLVVFGGSYGGGAGVRGDTWEFDGITWTQRFPLASLPARAGIAMAYDAARGATMTFGGYTLATMLADTWEYAPVDAATFTPFGEGCQGTGDLPAMAPVTLPWLGDIYHVAVSGLTASGFATMAVGWSDTAWTLGSLPFALNALTNAAGPGCDLRVSPDVLVFLPAVAGGSQYLLPIPNDAVFVGAVLFHQVVQLDTAAVEVTVSAGARMQMGLR
ncbi:MAG: kelch repeat-containing protein [Planctomycetota bacterium]|nr:kelch repeat-containing protein [Planctomycetota bacterium]